MLNIEKKPLLNILTCNNCHSTGRVGFKKCPECRGKSMGVFKRGKFLYWNYPLTRYHLSVASARHILNKVRRITFIILGVNFFIWMVYFIYKADLQNQIVENGILGVFKNISLYEPGFITSFFYLGVLCFIYIFYRVVVEKDIKEIVEKYDYNGDVVETETPEDWNNWDQVLKVKRKDRINIAQTFNKDALEILSHAYKIADKHGHALVKPVHIFYALLELKRIASIFLRLGIPTNNVRRKLDLVLEKQEKLNVKNKLSMPTISNEAEQILFNAYEESYLVHQEYVGVGELALSVVEQSEDLQEALYDLGIDGNKLANVIEWVRIRERLYTRYIKFSNTAKHRSKHGMDKALTAVATPYLNKFSEDLTYLSQMGYTDTTIGRDGEIQEMFRIVQGGGRNVLLVGDYGVGKKSIIDGMTEKMVMGDVPKRLFDKRLVRLSVPSLLAGTTPSGAVERLIRIMNDISRAGNVILFIHNIDDLVGVSTGSEKGSMDVTEALADYLNRGSFLTFATISSEGYSRYIVSSSIASVFTKVDVEEMTEDQAIQVLESKVGAVEYKHKVFFSYDALEKNVKLASRFIQDDYLPGSALEIMKESAAYTKNKKGENSLVTEKEVSEIISKKTKIPVSAVSADESTKLLRLEEEMHKRLIGQNEAVEAVANSLRRARAEIRSTNRPIANFLFLGPTGVGKTELAKTVAQIYFGGAEKIVRLDMSEYQDKSSVYRLIGNPGEKGTGILTEGIRQNPFTLLLLDEIEKADPNILNLFLQVMDDGRLTDSTGRTVDFTNVIIIATSNAGTSYVQSQINEGVDYDKIKENLLHGELLQNFRPEFLNRFDGIVLFKSLDRESIKKIARLMLGRVAKDLEKRGVGLDITEEALEYLVSVGYDPEFGARPMRRAIQEKVENSLAQLILKGVLKRKDVIEIGANGEVRVK